MLSVHDISVRRYWYGDLFTAFITISEDAIAVADHIPTVAVTANREDSVSSSPSVNVPLCHSKFSVSPVAAARKPRYPITPSA